MGLEFTKVTLHPERLDQPLRWKKPRRIFVNSMSDLFHEKIPDLFLHKVFLTMSMARHHTYQILTKRAERMMAYMRSMTNDWPGPMEHVWLGVSCEDQEQADKRIPLLLQTPAAVRFVSLEPLLGPIDLAKLTGKYEDGDRKRVFEQWIDALDWVIVGGESGGPPERALVERYIFKRKDLVHYPKSSYYPKDLALEWVRAIIRQCKAAGVPVLMKQWGGPTPKSGGRLVDGKLYHEFPQVAHGSEASFNR